MSNKTVDNTGEASEAYQRVTLTGQYLLAAIAIRRELAAYETPIEHLVEFGCGGGKSLWPSVPFVAEGGRVTGLDVSREHLDFAEINVERPRAARPDLSFRFLEVPPEGSLRGVADSDADVVQTSIVLQELREKEAIESLFRHVARVLRPGGLFVAACVGDRIVDEDFVSFTYAGFPSNRDPGSRVRACRSIEGGFVWVNDHHWTRRDLAEAATATGLADCRSRDVIASEELPPFPAEPWRSWKDETSTAPVLLFRCRRPSVATDA